MEVMFLTQGGKKKKSHALSSDILTMEVSPPSTYLYGSCITVGINDVQEVNLPRSRHRHLWPAVYHGITTPKHPK